MPTKRFCNTSISSLQDFYENSTTDANDLRLNMGEILENIAISKRDSKVFHFGVRTKVGDVDLHGAIFALRFIADYIEEQQKIGRISNRVQFSFSVAEVAAKPKHVFKPLSPNGEQGKPDIEPLAPNDASGQAEVVKE